MSCIFSVLQMEEMMSYLVDVFVVECWELWFAYVMCKWCLSLVKLLHILFFFCCLFYSAKKRHQHSRVKTEKMHNFLRHRLHRIKCVYVCELYICLFICCNSFFRHFSQLFVSFIPAFAHDIPSLYSLFEYRNVVFLNKFTIKRTHTHTRNTTHNENEQFHTKRAHFNIYNHLRIWENIISTITTTTKFPEEEVSNWYNLLNSLIHSLTRAYNNKYIRKV